MKTDFLSVAAQQFLAPAMEIQEAGETLARRAAPALGPEGIKRLRVIQGGAETLARMAQDLGGATVVLSALADAVPQNAPRTQPSTMTVVAGEAEFHPTPAATREAIPPVAPPPADQAIGPRASELDIARLVEGVAVDLLVAGAERGIEVGIAVEPDLVHPAAESAPLEAALREYGERVIAALPPGSAVTFGARRTASAIEIRVEGGASPLEISIPLAAA